jgi:hypothetical protein
MEKHSYTPAKTDKKPLAVALLLFMTMVSVASAQTFHAIMFADTFDQSIGESCLSDYERMEVEFATIARANNMKLDKHYYRDYDFTKEKVQEAINKLNCQVKRIKNG